jgi:hypothetical protein
MALEFPATSTRMVGQAVFATVNAETLQAEGKKITLPLPLGLSYGDTVEYNNTDLGTMRGSIVQAAERKNAGEDGTAASDQDNRSAFQKMTEEIANRFGGDTGRILVGSAPNPNTRALFKQVGIRSFQVSYKLITDSREEAENIKEIIKEFRTEMYPVPQFVGQTVTSFKFPKLFKIRFYLGNSNKEKYEIEPKLQPAYLQSFNVTYNSGGNAIMSDGKGGLSFSETDISMTFMEYRAQHQNDIRKGF